MKLLLDQGLPESTATLLRQAGIDTVHVREIGYMTAEDSDILKRAQIEGRCIVTFDADFHTLLALSGNSTPSAIRIRIEGLRSTELVNLLLFVIEQSKADLELGAVVTVQPHRIRVRRLPLLSIAE